jgi:hypothetical protein
MKTYQLTISRYTDVNQTSRDNWKDLISSLVLAGYEVYGDEEKIVFEIGGNDEIKEIKNER